MVVCLLSFELENRCRAKPGLVGVAGVALGLRKTPMAEYRHNFPARASSLSQAASGGLAQAVMLTVERQHGGGDRVPHEPRKAIDRERSTVFSVEDRHVAALGLGQHGAQFTVQANRQFRACLLLHDANRVAVDVGPGHPVHVAAHADLIEKAGREVFGAQMANHASSRTTQLYAPRK